MLIAYIIKKIEILNIYMFLIFKVYCMCSHQTMTNNINTEQQTNDEPVYRGSYDFYNSYGIDDENEFDRLIKKFEKEELAKYYFDDRPLDSRYDIYERRIVDEVVKADCGFIYEYSVFEYRDVEIDRRFRIFVGENT